MLNLILIAAGLLGGTQTADEPTQYRVQTLTGGHDRKAHRDGPFEKAGFANISQMVLTPDGNLYAVDVGEIRIVPPGGPVRTLPREVLRFWEALAVDPKGRLYAADDKGKVFELQPDTGQLTLLCGGEGYRDGPLGQALFREIRGLAVDSAGNIFVSDSGNCRIRRIGTDGVVSTVAGSPALISTRFEDANDSFEDLVDLFLTIAGGTPLNKYQKRDLDAFLEGPLGPEIRQLIPVFEQKGMEMPLQEVQRLVEPLTFRDGPAVMARFFEPKGITLDENGHILVADSLNNRIRSIAPSGEVQTLAGGQLGYQDGPAAQARFNMPTAITRDTEGNLFVADTGNHCIRKIGPQGQVTTIAGGIKPGNRDGVGTQARLSSPVGIATKEDGTIYVSEDGSRAVRVLIPVRGAESEQPNLSEDVASSEVTAKLVETVPVPYQIGMPQQELIAAVGDDYLVAGKGRITYWRKILGYDARVSYQFNKDGRLDKVLVIFGAGLNTDNEWVEAHRSIRAQMIKAYGKPVSDRSQWFVDTYEGQADRLGRAVRAGHVSFWTGWEKPETVKLFLGGGPSLRLTVIHDYWVK